MVKSDLGHVRHSVQRIPRSWPVRLRRLQFSALPLIVFAATVIGCAWLWQMRGLAVHSVGEVEASRVDVASPLSGVVVQLSRNDGGMWSIFDRVAKGDVLATLDDRQAKLNHQMLLHELEVLEADGAECQKELTSAELEEGAKEALRAMLASALASLEKMRSTLLKFGGEHSAATPASHLTTQQTSVQFPANVPQELQMRLNQFQAALRSFSLKLDQYQLESERLVIRAPIPGTLVAIYCWPGQAVPQNGVIATIAAEHGRHIVSFLPEESMLQATAGMPVKIRSRGRPDFIAASSVEQLGAQLDQMPQHLLGPNSSPRWGLPVRVKLPQGLDLRPGSLVDIVFYQPTSRVTQ